MTAVAPIDARRRRTAFAVAVAILALGFIAIQILRGGEEEGGYGGAPRPAAVGPDLSRDRDGRTAQAAVRVSKSFLRAYLNFQVGISTAEDRAAISSSATSALRQDLLSVPPRAQPGTVVAREQVVGIAEIAVGLHGGEPALRVGITVTGGGGRRVLTVTLLRRPTGWLVVEVES